MKPMSVTFDTSHLEIPPGIVFALVIESKNNQLISVTAETCHDSVGPCGPLEQSLPSFRHSTMAAWSSALDFGAQPAVGTIGVRKRITIMIRIRVRARVTAGLRSSLRYKVAGARSGGYVQRAVVLRACSLHIGI